MHIVITKRDRGIGTHLSVVADLLRVELVETITGYAIYYLETKLMGWGHKKTRKVTVNSIRTTLDFSVLDVKELNLIGPEGRVPTEVVTEVVGKDLNYLDGLVLHRSLLVAVLLPHVLTDAIFRNFGTIRIKSILNPFLVYAWFHGKPHKTDYSLSGGFDTHARTY